MINVSNEFKRKMSGGQGEFLPFIDITLANGKKLPTFTKNNLINNGLKMTDGVTSSGEFTIGSCIINKADITLDNTDESLSEYDFSGATVTSYIGLQLSGGMEKIRKGVFTVDEATYTEPIIKLQCLDNMHKLDKNYSEVKTAYPNTIGVIVRDICTVCGIVLLNNNFPNYQYKIQQRPSDEALTCRQILAYAAQIAGGFARCDTYGRLELRWFEQGIFEHGAVLDGGRFDDSKPYSSGDDVSGGAFDPWNVGVGKAAGTFDDQNKFHHLFYYRSLAVATDDVVITGIQVTEEFTETETEKKQTVLYGQEGYVLKISGNKFIQQGAAGTVAKYLGEKLIGLRFRPMSGQFLDNPTIEAGDLTYVSDRKLRVYNCLVTNLTYTVGGSISVSCDAATPGKNSADRYSEFTQNAVDLRKNTEEKLGEYDKSVKMLTALITQSFGVYQTEEKQGDGSSILYLHDKSTINESKTIWKMTSDAFAVSTDGGKTWNAGIDSSGNAVVNALSAVGIRWDWASGGTLTLGGKGNNKGRLEVLDDNDKLMTVLDEKGIQHYDGSESVPYHYRTESVEISFLEEEFEGGGTKTCVVHVDQPISSLFSKEFLDYYVTYGSKSVQATATINEIISPAAPSDSVMYVLGTFGVRSPKIYRDDTNTPCLKMDVECSYISCAFNNLKPRYTKPLKVTLTVNIVY